MPGVFGIDEVKTMRYIIILLLLAFCCCDGLEDEPVYVELPALYRPLVTVFDNQIFVICNYHLDKGSLYPDYGGIYSSENGKDWILAKDKPKFKSRIAAAAVEFNGKLWIIGGLTADSTRPSTITLSDVWSSKDGWDWELVTDNAFQARMFHSVIVHNGKMWVIGGQYEANGFPCTDACSSIDGKNWTCYNSNLISSGNPCVVQDGKLYVSSGDFIAASDDAVIWTTISTDTLVPARELHSFLFYQDKFWIFGGKERSGSVPARLYDVWNTTPTDLGNWFRVSMDALHDTIPTSVNMFEDPGYGIVVFRDRLWVITGGYWDKWDEENGKWDYVSYNKCSTDGVTWVKP
jgi:hypothetical protein